MTSLLSPQVELSNGRAVYLKPAEQGAPQVRASLTNRMMTPIACLIRAAQGTPRMMTTIACLIRAAQGAPRAPRRPSSPSSHLAIFTPRYLHTSPSSHLTSAQFALTTALPPTLLLPLHACPFTDAPLVHTGRPLVDPSAHPAKEDHLRGARFGARTSPHLRNLAHLRHRALPRGPQRAARALRHERRDGARRRGRAALPPPVRPPLIAI